jgi:hypothetical protein
MIRRHFEIGDLAAMANARDAEALCADADHSGGSPVPK